jgi:hypothetical protein
VVAKRPPAPPAGPRFEVSASYGALVPTTLAFVRHGLTVRLSAPWGRLPVAAFADVAFTTEPTATVDGRAVSARIWPIGVGVALRLVRPRWQLSGGPRVSLQIVDASAAASDGRSGSAERYSAGLGLIGDATWRFSRWVGAIVTVGAEALVPRIALKAGGTHETDLGWVQFAFTGGLLVSLP